MELITKAPKGTVDIIPGESEKWSLVEAVMTDEAELNGFSEIRTPVFEHTELFLRSVGDTTDVVEKQMYTFEDKGGRSITLRPEGTAGAVRAMLENGLYNGGYPVKLYYKTSCYRYEKPQAGRLRELHQFGVEMFGTAEPAADAQVIAMAMSIFNRLGLADDIEVSINSIGCPTCRAEYRKALRTYFEGYKNQLCETCNSRLERNPMRILDCKSPVCGEIAKGAPKITDYLCDDCRAHFEKVQMLLNPLIQSETAKTPHSFYQALKKPGMSYICEVKKASPSKGLIAPDFPYLDIAKEYKAAGAVAISCLTEPFYFQGSDQYLWEIASEVDIPVLRKDFVIDDYMILQAAAYGAAAVLLICALLDDTQLREYREMAEDLGMDALVEAHDAQEVERALKSGARIIGVNNRDLKTFEVDMANSINLRKLAPENVIFVSESGIRTSEDIQRLHDNKIEAVLVGETLMRSPDKKAALEELNGAPLTED